MDPSQRDLGVAWNRTAVSGGEGRRPDVGQIRDPTRGSPQPARVRDPFRPERQSQNGRIPHLGMPKLIRERTERAAARLVPCSGKNRPEGRFRNPAIPIRGAQGGSGVVRQLMRRREPEERPQLQNQGAGDSAQVSKKHE
jgi:hypothetical protein